MTGDQQHSNLEKKNWLAGTGLIFLGAISLLELTIQTGWLVFIVPPIVGVGMIFLGREYEKQPLFVVGCLFFSLGVGVFVVKSLGWLPYHQIIGVILFSLGLGFCGIIILPITRKNQISWWALVPGLIFLFTGIIIFNNNIDSVNLSVGMFLATGVSLGLWGIARRWIGLLIPASLSLGSGLGLFLGWGSRFFENDLARTGIMLLCFGASWLLIIAAARFVLQVFIWWPFIPGGIFIVVGIGLYAGGNPGSALHLIGNASSISFIIFGIYLLLLRKGIQK